jgi:hypothetical protein
MAAGLALAKDYPYLGTLSTCKNTNIYSSTYTPRMAPPIKQWKYLYPGNLPATSATLKDALRNQTLAIAVNSSCRFFYYISSGILRVEDFTNSIY